MEFLTADGHRAALAKLTPKPLLDTPPRQVSFATLFAGRGGPMVVQMTVFDGSGTFSSTAEVKPVRAAAAVRASR